MFANYMFSLPENLMLVVIIAALSVAINLLMGAVVYLGDRRSVTNKIFALLNLVLALYIIANLLGTFRDSPSERLWWVRVVMLSAVLLGSTFHYFIRVFPDPIFRITRKELIFSLTLTILTSLLTLSPLVFSGLEIGERGAVPSPIVQPGIIIFGVVVSGYTLSGLYLLLKKYKNAHEIFLRSQIQYLIAGTSIMFGAFLVLNFLVVIIFDFTYFINFTPVYVSAFIIFASYAILRQHLFDIKVIATELATFALWLLLLVRAILGGTLFDIVIGWTVFIASIFVGISLIRSVLKEIETREKMEEMAVKLEVANEELKKLDEAKSDFISIASHQLRTPLTIIKGYISMMREGTFGKLTKKVAEPLDKVYLSNERLINLVADLLDLSRMERGKMVYDMREVHLVPAIEGLITDFKIAAENKGLKYSWSKKVTNDLVKADENKIRQIILNFIDNAIKYTPSGKVDVALVQEGHTLRFAVTDTGSGLSEEEANTLFQKFVRGQQEKKSHTEGLGLGLYVAKLIAEAHGGTLGATSPGKGKGSTFYLTLPILDVTNKKVEEFASKL